RTTCNGRPPTGGVPGRRGPTGTPGSDRAPPAVSRTGPPSAGEPGAVGRALGSEDPLLHLHPRLPQLAARGRDVDAAGGPDVAGHAAAHEVVLQGLHDVVGRSAQV